MATFKISKSGFYQVSEISFDDLFDMLATCVELLKRGNFNNGDKLLSELEKIKFTPYKEGQKYLLHESYCDCYDEDKSPYVVMPCKSIAMSYGHSIASAFDEFTNSNSIHQEGYLLIVALAQILGSACGHYHIREWGGDKIFFLL